MIDIFYFDKVLKKGTFEDINSIKQFTLWIDIIDINKEESEKIEKYFGIHQLTIEDFFNNKTRVKIENFNQYLFCVFYGIKDDDKIETVKLDFILGENFIITNHHLKINSFEELKDTSNVEKLLEKGPDYIFHKLLDMEIDNYFPVFEKIDEEIEKIEEKAIIQPNSELMSEILKIKKTVANLKIISLAQREKISFIIKNDYKFISKENLPYFRDIYDHAIRASDMIENSKESIGNTFDVYMSTVSNNINEVMKVLSIIATITLPLGVISGIYGTNFLILPGSKVKYGFWIMVSIMLIMITGMLYYFKKKRWL